MYGGTLDFQCQHISNGNIKYPIGKSIFAVNLSLQLFPAIVANSDIKRLKSLHTFLKKCLYYMLVKFEQNCMVQITRDLEFFDKKIRFKKTKQNKTKNKNKNKNKNIFDKALTPFWKTFL